MACGTCGGSGARQDYVVTYADGSTKRFTNTEGGYPAARMEVGMNPGASLKAVQPLK